MRRLTAIALTVVLAVGILGCGSLDSHYVAADRDTHDAIAPYVAIWIAADSLIATEERAALEDLWESWGFRLEQAEELVGDSARASP